MFIPQTEHILMVFYLWGEHPQPALPVNTPMRGGIVDSLSLYPTVKEFSKVVNS